MRFTEDPRHHWRLLALCTFSLAACGGDSTSGGTEGTLKGGARSPSGSKDFDEQLILGNISKLALENAGADVDRPDQPRRHQRRPRGPDLGEIDTYWEYNGTAWISFVRETEPIPDRVKQYEAVRDRDKKENNLVWLAPAEFNNTYASPTRPRRPKGSATRPRSPTSATSSPTTRATPRCASRASSPAATTASRAWRRPRLRVPGRTKVTVLDTALVYAAADKQDPCNFGEVFTSDGRISGARPDRARGRQGLLPPLQPSPVFTAGRLRRVRRRAGRDLRPDLRGADAGGDDGMNEGVSVNLPFPEQVAEDSMKNTRLILSD